MVNEVPWPFLAESVERDKCTSSSNRLYKIPVNSTIEMTHTYACQIHAIVCHYVERLHRLTWTHVPCVNADCSSGTYLRDCGSVKDFLFFLRHDVWTYANLSDYSCFDF